MAKVACESGKSFKDDSALGQHRRDSPRHQQKAEPSANASGTSNPSSTAPDGKGTQVNRNSSRGQNDSWFYADHSNTKAIKKPLTAGPVPYFPRYPPIQSVRAGQSSGAAATSNKKTKTKKGTGTGSFLPAIKFTEYGYPYIPGLGDEDWSVCDKDCGWCGHCADHLDI